MIPLLYKYGKCKLICSDREQMSGVLKMAGKERRDYEETRKLWGVPDGYMFGILMVVIVLRI